MSASRTNKTAISARTKTRRAREFNKAVDAVHVCLVAQIHGAVTKGETFRAGPLEDARARMIVRAVLTSVGHSAARG